MHLFSKKNLLCSALLGFNTICLQGIMVIFAVHYSNTFPPIFIKPYSFSYSQGIDSLLSHNFQEKLLHRFWVSTGVKSAHFFVSVPNFKFWWPFAHWKYIYWLSLMFEYTRFRKNSSVLSFQHIYNPVTETNNKYLPQASGNPLQYSCLDNPMDRGAWWAMVYGVAELDMTEMTAHT